MTDRWKTVLIGALCGAALLWLLYMFSGVILYVLKVTLVISFMAFGPIGFVYIVWRLAQMMDR